MSPISNPGQPASAGNFADEPLDKRDQHRMPPGAIARRAHDLPVRPVGGKLDPAFEAAPLIGADRLGPPWRRRHLEAEDALRRIMWQLRQ